MNFCELIAQLFLKGLGGQITEVSDNLPRTSYTNRRYFAARENRDFVGKLNESEDYLFSEQREKKLIDIPNDRFITVNQTGVLKDRTLLISN